ncbi:MAG: hypothetical protein GY834_03155, partial [Bacteroidetes bacterium]|nr:hypothetical protein [Bacteroidota bacterium]
FWKVKIVESHNSSGQMGTFSCENNGGYCHNVNELAILSNGESWSNIKFPKMSVGMSIYACIVPGSGQPPDFPSTIDLEYEYICE